MSDSEIIECPIAADTVEKVIFKLCPERVLGVDYENMLISRHQLSSSSRQFRKVQGYYISRNLRTEHKKMCLDRIADRLRISMKVEIVSK
jgi:hypothetical protein